jgi:hypothetical protein
MMLSSVPAEMPESSVSIRSSHSSGAHRGFDHADRQDLGHMRL